MEEQENRLTEQCPASAKGFGSLERSNAAVRSPLMENNFGNTPDLSAHTASIFASLKFTPPPNSDQVQLNQLEEEPAGVTSNKDSAPLHPELEETPANGPTKHSQEAAGYLKEETARPAYTSPVLQNPHLLQAQGSLPASKEAAPNSRHLEDEAKAQPPVHQTETNAALLPACEAQDYRHPARELELAEAPSRPTLEPIADSSQGHQHRQNGSMVGAVDINQQSKLSTAQQDNLQSQRAAGLTESQSEQAVAGRQSMGSPRQKGKGTNAKKGVKRKAPGASPEKSSKEDAEALHLRLSTAWEQFNDEIEDRTYFCEVNFATLTAPFAALEQAVHVHWPDEDAWFPGTIVAFDETTGKHKVAYADDDEEDLWLVKGLERVRAYLPLSKPLTPPNPSHLHTMSHALLEQSRLKEVSESHRKTLQGCSLKLRMAAEEMAMGRGGTDPLTDSSMGREQPILPGHVVWARCKGYPSWPSLVSTTEEANAHGLGGAQKGKICLQAFGDFTWFSVKPSDIIPFGQGIKDGLYTKGLTKVFQRALFEVTEYLQEGRLPADMVPDNNDQGFSSDDEIDTAWRKQSAEELSDVKISQHLTVCKFGRVEFLHPGFHNEKHIWPVGYKAVSIRESPDSKTPEAEYVCEITMSENNAGPLFRISCLGKSAESMGGPQKAWQRLKSLFKKKSTPLGDDGLKVFGLNHPRVFEHILQMKDANRCENFCAWPQGSAPIFPKLTISEKRERALAELAMQQLPEGIKGVPLTAQQGARCEACGIEEESEDNPMLQCDGPCRLFVHQACCGLLGKPPSSWMCDLCKSGSSVVPACVVCPVKGGILLRTKCKRFCHAACALWIPEACADASISNPLIAEVDVSHIPKARKQLSCMLCKQNYGACIQCAGSRACYSAFHVLCARQAGLPMNTDFKLLKLGNQSGAAGDSVAAPPRKKLKVDGTSMGDGTRLVCYCPKHAHMGESQSKRQSAAPEAANPSQIRQSPPPASTAQPSTEGLQAERGPSVEAPLREGPEHQEEDVPGCARCVPFNHAIRRGMRAPEALENALAKRLFMQQTPYLVGNMVTPQEPKSALSSTCARRGSEDPRFHSKTLDVSRPSKKGAKKLELSITHRYGEMRASEITRIALGKSKIHGWGAISKVAHRKGDMVIEYSGEAIRASLADVRERGMYDQVVGAGTYIFKLNDDFCIDATRAGNMAHMLNHSCQPNCFSRAISVTNKEGQIEEHVVIFAGEDIPAGQELTYNYRFSSTEELPCNCSAPKCCGLVNATGAAQLGYELAPRHELIAQR